jgi:hypothetical protein
MRRRIRRAYLEAQGKARKRILSQVEIFLALLKIEPERAAHGRRRRVQAAFQARRADEGKRLVALDAGEIAIPRLAHSKPR